ncbi:Panthothenate synthetase [Phaffia rhodozyma]|uniref:Pantoate--beta-alanine ligase n=1 Tax=Phaffia rhodozyma TaxID=264483 RepID=A0A0F7SSL7_PHARH|nr:Panthothenate synthetase [Phaffia rhodozyma]
MSQSLSASSLRALASNSSVPVLTSVKQVRQWRKAARDAGKSVGFVPTMGSLHQGHLDLVSRSLEKSPLTILSIFVNPSQFSPTEDLATYPRDLPKDLSSLTTLLESHASSAFSSAHKSDSVDAPVNIDSPLVVFVPDVKEMYPNGITTEVSEQKGAFVEVKGYGDILEGAARPNFFRGVATVVTKLFNIVQPDYAHFGQKDIQQALLLRTMLKDLHFSAPSSSNLLIHPTTRSPPPANLALSSRNAYLSERELLAAPALQQALTAGHAHWLNDPMATAQDVRRAAAGVIYRAEMMSRGLVEMEYIGIFRPGSFEVVRGDEPLGTGKDGEGWVMAGAIKVGKTRLLDNILLGVDLAGEKKIEEVE